MKIPKSVHDASDLTHAPTPPLNDFLAAYGEDDNWWWRIECGHHRNLFDMALDRIDELETQLEQLRRFPTHGGA